MKKTKKSAPAERNASASGSSLDVRPSSLTDIAVGLKPGIEKALERAGASDGMWYAFSCRCVRDKDGGIALADISMCKSGKQFG